MLDALGESTYIPKVAFIEREFRKYIDDFIKTGKLP